MSDKLLRKMQDAYNRVEKEAVAGIYGKRYVPAKDTPDDDIPDIHQDFPYVDDPEGYTTHVPLEQDELKEAEGDPEPQKPIEAGEEAGEEAGSAPEGEEGGIGDMGMDEEGNMPGVEGGEDMPEMAEQKEEELSLTQIGRVYELKKIYSRLASVESFLSRTTDDSILEVRRMVAQSIDLFEVVISNFNQYKDNVDEIIVTYYEFLNVVYESLKKHFSKTTKE